MLYRNTQGIVAMAQELLPQWMGLTDESITCYIRQLATEQLLKSPIYDFLLSNVTIKSATKGIVRAKLRLTRNHVNSDGKLHSSVSTAFVVWAGTLAIGTWNMSCRTSNATDIHVNYGSPAEEGDEVGILGRAENVNGLLAFTWVTIFKLENGNPIRVIARGTHTKRVMANRILHEAFRTTKAKFAN
ncbi:HotDog domain-containing protein [Whalleya microplaca]|nr:HotDog domain-containing protein [Whalleya microplaca]